MPQPAPQPNGTAGGGWRPGPGASLAVLAILVTALYAGLLFSRRELVPCLDGADFFTEFGWLRLFGFGELRHGNLALWNPWVFCGMPAHGYQQSALLYPPNWLYLVLGVARATTVTLGFQLVLTGWFACLWLRYHRVRADVALLGGILYMFGGAVYLHVMAGHLTVLSSVAWLPLALLAAEGILDTGRWRYALLGAAAMGSQLLGGHTQYVFYTGLAVAGLAALRLPGLPGRWRRLALLAAMLLGTLLLGAAQLVPALAASAESNRAGGIPLELAAQVSLPPESLLTLLVPGLFGNHLGAPYWGRWFGWETSLYVSATALVLAAIGRCHGDPAKRPWALTMLLAAWVLALGVHTPLFKLLHGLVPGFDLFRGWAKFNAIVSLYTILLAMAGLDRLLAAPLPAARRWAAACWVLAAAMLAAGCSRLAWRWLVKVVVATGETRVTQAMVDDPGFWLAVGRFGLLGVLIAAVVLAAAGGMLWAAKHPPHLLGLAGLALLEILLFAWTNRAVAVWDPVYDPHLPGHLAANPDVLRIDYQKNPNIAMYHRRRDIWGIGALRPARYAEFMAASQGLPPEQAWRLERLWGPSPMFRTLGFGLGYWWQADDTIRVVEQPGALPRLSLVARYEVVTERGVIFARLSDPAFDPAHTVLLETPPDPLPDPVSPPGTVRLVSDSSDELVIEADTPAPALLLLADSYSRHWRAEALPGSAQAAYSILPANYAIRAIPLAAGRHALRLVYRPPGYAASLAVSALAWLAAAGLGLAAWKRRDPIPAE